MTNILSGFSYFALMFSLVSCAPGAKYATGCLEFDNKAPVAIYEVAKDFSEKASLLFRDMDSSLTIRQKEAGKKIYSVEGKYVKFIFIRAEEGVTSICAYDESGGVEEGRVIALLEELKKILKGRLVDYREIQTVPSKLSTSEDH